MQITVNVVDGKLTVSVVDLLTALSKEDKDYLVEGLSCEDAIIGHVTDQIVEGFTGRFWHGWDNHGDEDPHTALGKARRRVAKCAGDVARGEIEDLEKSLTSCRDQQKKMRKQLIELREGRSD